MSKVVKFSNSGPMLAEEQIVSFEYQISVSLPEEYRSFLLAHNGGYPNPNNFRFGERSESCVHHFYALIDSASTIGLRWAYHTYLGNSSRMPRELFPIGSDPGGNVICLATGGSQVGSIYFWDHEKEERHGYPANYKNVYHVNDSFVFFSIVCTQFLPKK